MSALLTHRLGWLVIVGVIVLVLPVAFPSAYYYRVGALVFIFALAALGLNLLMALPAR